MSGLIGIAVLTSCKKDNNDPGTPPGNEEELITTVKLRFENTADANDTVCASFKDTDGDGGNDPSQFDTIILDNSKEYLLSISLLDESSSETENLTTEVEEEAEEHQFFFGGSSITSGALSVVYGDMDGNGNPIGLQDTVTTSVTGSNMVFQVTLRHEPDKFGTNVSDGDITNAGGETDIELDFIIDIQ